MKRKLFSILFALAIVLSFSLVTAVPAPVAAEPGEAEGELVGSYSFEWTTSIMESTDFDFTVGMGWSGPFPWPPNVYFFFHPDEIPLGGYTEPIGGAWLFENIDFDETAAGQTFSVTSVADDPDFAGFASLLTNGIDELIWFGYMGDRDNIASAGGQKGVQEAQVFSGTDVGTDFPGWVVQSVSLTFNQIYLDPENVNKLVLDYTLDIYAAPPIEVWVDDDASPEWYAEPTHFAIIQNGIDLVAEAGTVNVLAGTYLQGDQINVDKSLVIQGAGREDTEVRRAGTPVYGQYWRVFDVSAESDVTIRDMTVGYETLLPATSDTPVPGYVIAHLAGYSPTNNLTIDNVAFDGGRSAILSSGTGLVVRNCLVTGEWQRASIRPTGTNFLITTNVFQGLHYQYGPAMLSGDAVEGEISYNQMSNGAIPGYFKTSGSVFTIESYTNASGTGNLVIKSNTFDGTNRTDVVKEGGNPLYTLAIYFESAGYDGSKIFVQDNTFTGYNYGVWVPGTTTVSGNEFNSNDTQLGLYEAVGGIPETAIDDILANNTFDRAVVVDHDGASLLHTIWSSIQDGVNAAVTDDTVIVVAGTYNEVVAVDESVNLLGANAGVCAGVNPGARGDESIVNAFKISANNVVVDGFQINGAKVGGSGDATNAIVIDGGTSGHTISNNILPGPGGTPPAGTDRGIVFGYYVSSTTVSCNEIYGWKTGIYINPTNPGSNLLFQYNNIHHNWAGIGSDGLNDVSILNNDFSNNVEGFGSSNVGVNVGVHFNNFTGNGAGINWYSGNKIDATKNWWGDASGPSHSPGYGDPISDNVLYDPWLLGPVVPGVPPPTTFDKTLALNIGWTLVSTDNWIDATKTVGVGVILAYKYTPGLGWSEVEPTALVPVDALYLKTDEGGALGITYLGGYPAPSSKTLVAGWNLISSATIDNAKAVLSPLRYVLIGGQQGIGLTTLVSQGNFNQHTVSFYLSTLDQSDWDALVNCMLNPFDGYWVYMNATKLFGVVPN